MTSALKALPMPLVLVSPSLDIVAGNDAFGRAWAPAGMPVDMLDLIHKDDHGKLSLAVRRVLEENKDQVLEARFMTGGLPRWSRMSLTPAPLTSEDTGCVLLAPTDAEREKAAQLELEERETRWNNALVSSDLGVWDHNNALRRKYYSNTWRKIRGLAPEDPLAVSKEEWLQKVHPDDRDRVLEAMERQSDGDPDYAIFEYREQHKDGHWVWIECRGACVERDANGAALRIIGTDTDITERKAAEAEFLRLSRRLEMALEISGVGVFEADFDSGITEWDERMFAIYGLQGSGIIEIGGLWESLLHPDDKERVIDNVIRNWEHEAPFADEYRVILRDGTERTIRSYSKCFVDTDGHRKMVGANWDITRDVVLRRELERAKLLAEARSAELEAAHGRVEHIALHDHLTSLPNRRYFEDVLEAASAIEHSKVAVLHIDLDRFKQINDTLGHLAGDHVLRVVAERLKGCVKAHDFVARIGGDEFVLICMDAGSARMLSALAQRIIKEIGKPLTYESNTCRVGASIGIASADSGTSARQLLSNADIALYRAKSRGRNCHEFFSQSALQEITSAKHLSDDILRALEAREFVPFYQLQFDAKSLAVVGVETLVRWAHQDGRLLSPDSFLPMAEELGIVADIDAVVLETALADARRWRGMGFSIPKISVNVSYRRLSDPTLLKKLEKLAIPPGTLAFELLESIFLDECDGETLERLTQLRQLGIELEVDDFGSGHASIISLLKVSPHALKIDRELIKRIPQSRKQQKLISSIIDIGKSLGIKVIAEGVETNEHVRLLQQLGCDVLQGYALAKPTPFDGIVDVLTMRRLAELRE
ncbi:sensor domain-containing protein [Neorhizobium sp. SOG26]|uniref:sensor domain-containing protein n=1 Tax=Neorhizobium sp. SOG26 TaxID=2060726 RepID=UPI001FDEB9DA|nr:EAL domain-containing protein [Neorhizobium sp. SOG26]